MHPFSRLSLLGLLVICLSSTTSYSLHEYLCVNYPKYSSRSKSGTLSWPQFRNKYVLAIASVFIGAVSGYLSIYVEQLFGFYLLRDFDSYLANRNLSALLWTMIVWYFERDIRNMTVESIRQDLNYSDGTDLSLLFARISSWIMYLSFSGITEHAPTVFTSAK